MDMRITRWFCLSWVLLSVSAYGAIAGPPPVAWQGELPSLAPMLKKVLPGVVSIAVRGHVAAEDNPLLSDPFFRRFFGLPEQPEEREFQAAGSGVVVDSTQGYLITNNHVVEKADEINVTLSDGRRLQGKKIGTDPETDIAVVQIRADHLSGLPLGNSDNMRVGDYVVAVGNPFGLEQTVTAGIVSALGRTGLGIEGYESFIQTDASINPGNSGGALVNLKGELVGINTAIIGPTGGNVGIGFAIPINMARQIMQQLIAHGKVSRGQLGVMIQDLTPELAKALEIDDHAGALIARVMPKSPAFQAGLEAGDVITAVNGKKIASASELKNQIGLLAADSKVTFDIIHKGVKKQVTTHLVEAVSEELEVPAAAALLSGVTLGAIEPGMSAYGRVEGAVVLDMKRGARALAAGLHVGDIIVGVNQEAVTSPQDVVRIASAVKGKLLLQVIRDDSALFIIIG
jgi:Do/DeqQ family serine protease